MNTDNEKTLMQSLRTAPDAGEALLRLPEFAGFASSDEILAARQDGALNADQLRALNSALASSNAMRQQWLALSAAVPHAKHGAVWHGLFRWHWATIGMSACVALVGVLLFHQGQLPLLEQQPSASFSESSSDSVVMREPLAESPEIEADLAVGDRVGISESPQAKALREMPQKRELASEPAEDRFSDEQAEIASAPLMASRAAPEAKPQPGPLAPSAPSAPSTLATPSTPSLPAATSLMPQVEPDWSTWLAVYRGEQVVDADSDMAQLAQAVLAVEASECAAAQVAALQQVFQTVKLKYPGSVAALEPDSEAGWCEMGAVLEETARNQVR